MDQGFSKNVIKPGDKGYQYDKRVDFNSKVKEDNSWDEGSQDEDDDNYFDDDFA